MGKLNTITKEYMSKPLYFADAFNSALFDGVQIVKADELVLEEKDPTEMGIIITEDGEDITQNVRDVLKKSVIMSNGKMNLLLLGIENQSEVHYAMPVKNLIYDALNYGQQVKEAASVHRQKKDLKGAEFLSGFAKTDKLMPVITLTVYFGSDEWDAPRSLKDMFPENTSEDILEKVDDYKLNLIVPKEIKDFSKFKTDLGKAMKYIAVSDQKEGIVALSMESDYQEVSADTVHLIIECTGSHIPVSEGEEVVHMSAGVKAWIEEVEAKKVAEVLVENVESLMENLTLTLETACNAIGSSVQKYEDAKKLLNK